MNWDQIAGKWKQYKGDVQMKWGKLSGDDMDQVDGNREKLIGKIQERYGKNKEEAQKEVDDYINGL